MPVTSEVAKSGPYTGNGVTVSFPYSFKILDASHIRVVRTEDGADTDLVAGFTVGGVGLDAGGAVVFIAAPTALQQITLVRNVPITQEIDLVNQGAFFAEVVERGFDLAAMRDQQLQEQIDRSVKLTIGQDIGDFYGLIEDVIALASIRTDVSVLAGVKAEVQAVSAVIPALETVAINVLDVQNFADIYQINSVLPTTRTDGSALEAGDLWFDEVEGKLKNWTGLVWVLSASSVNGIISSVDYLATAAQTVFAAVYDVGFVHVYKNGLKLKGGGVEFTAVNGTSVTLITPAALNDKINIISFGAFSAANMLEKSQSLADVPDKGAARTALDVRKIGEGLATDFAASALVVDSENPFANNNDTTIPATSAVINVAASRLIVVDAKAQGTNGGTFSSGAWRTRDLNTVRHNGISGASVSANQITLPAGTYLVRGSAPALQVNNHKCRLQDITNGVTLIGGTTEITEQMKAIVSNRSHIIGSITLAGSTVMEVQHWCSAGFATTGFGPAFGNGVEIYAEIDFQKIA